MSELQQFPDDTEIDPEAAMREMMGFSSFESFTTRPKKRPGTSDANDTSHNQASSATGANSQPLPDRPNFNQSRLSDAIPDAAEQQQPTPISASILESSFSTQQQPAYVFTSPHTGTAYTKQDLEELARGRVNEQGDKVYFKPGFVDDDPWSRLHNRVQSRSSNGGGRGKRSRDNGEAAEHEHQVTAEAEAPTISN